MFGFNVYLIYRFSMLKYKENRQEVVCRSFNLLNQVINCTFPMSIEALRGSHLLMVTLSIMETKNLNEMSLYARINELIRTGDTYRELENYDSITSLMVMGDYFVEMTLDKKTRELKGMEIKEDSETLLKYFAGKFESDSKAA
jgi:hypothetical protein